MPARTFGRHLISNLARASCASCAGRDSLRPTYGENDLKTKESPPGTPEEIAGRTEAPIRVGERLQTLDILRGFALLGILLLNIEDFAGHEAVFDFPVGLAKPAFIGWHAHLDYALVIFNWIFAEGKMRTLFSMLFGAGVVLLTERIDRGEGAKRTATVFYRRNMWLLLLGLCHGLLIWAGDILLEYAILALVFLYPLRRLTARDLIVLGVLIALVGSSRARILHTSELVRNQQQLLATKLAGASASPKHRALLAANAKKEQESSAATAIREGQLSYVASLRRNEADDVSFVRHIWTTLRFLETLGAMLVGMGLYKIGFLTNRRPAQEYVLLAAAAYIISSTVVLTGLWHTYRAGFTAVANAEWMANPYMIEVLSGSFANACVGLLMVRSGRLRWLQILLAAVGRTALSNYIMTSLLCKWLFSWGPWKLYGQLEFYQWYIVVLAVWTLNMTISWMWLRTFAFGPLEWLWRSLTYWKRQPWSLRAAR